MNDSNKFKVLIEKEGFINSMQRFEQSSEQYKSFMLQQYPTLEAVLQTRELDHYKHCDGFAIMVSKEKEDPKISFKFVFSGPLIKENKFRVKRDFSEVEHIETPNQLWAFLKDLLAKEIPGRLINKLRSNKKRYARKH